MMPITPDENTLPVSLDSFKCSARSASEFLKALSHETRLMILCILGEGEKTVGEIEQILGLQQAMVSQQLARLRLEELVQARREGRLIFYSIAHPHVEEIVAVLYRLYCAPLPQEHAPVAELR